MPLETLPCSLVQPMVTSNRVMTAGQKCVDRVACTTCACHLTVQLLERMLKQPPATLNRLRLASWLMQSHAGRAIGQNWQNTSLPSHFSEITLMKISAPPCAGPARGAFVAMISAILDITRSVFHYVVSFCFVLCTKHLLRRQVWPLYPICRGSSRHYIWITFA